MVKLKTLEDFLIEELKDLYSAEKQIIKVLPKMIRAASSGELRQAFEDHLKETKGHISRLDEISEAVRESLNGKKCVAMEGLLEEGMEIMNEDMEPQLLDVALIATTQKVEHYEIASYGTVVTYAELLDKDEIANLLNKTLDEEKATDERLTEIAKDINGETMLKGDEEGEEEVENFSGKGSKKAGVR